MTPTPMVQLVCIDNKQTRKQILSSKAIEITKVPCLLILEDTTVEKYDGERAFQWVGEVFKKLTEQSQPPPPPPQTVIQIEPQVEQPRVRSVQPQFEEEDEDEQTKPPPSRRPKKKQQKPKKETRIEDLDDIEEDEEESEQPIKRPPVPIRNGAGSYSLNEDIFSEQENDRVEKTNSTSKGAGILDLAFAMRQEREKENKDINK
jgi:hypothetical protein